MLFRSVCKMSKKFAYQSIQISIRVNEKLKRMPNTNLMITVSIADLTPIKYLDRRTISLGYAAWCGYARYLDAYLLYHSGDRRTRLRELGKQLTGQEPAAKSARLLRQEIIQNFFCVRFSTKIGLSGVNPKPHQTYE